MLVQLLDYAFCGTDSIFGAFIVLFVCLATDIAAICAAQENRVLALWSPEVRLNGGAYTRTLES